jgi:hypothetical protein
MVGSGVDTAMANKYSALTEPLWPDGTKKASDIASTPITMGPF